MVTLDDKIKSVVLDKMLNQKKITKLEYQIRRNPVIGIKIYENTSRKYLQHPRRLSGQFKWQPKEQITIAENLPDGYIVNNIDYCGMEKCFETAFITFTMFNQNFTLLK